MPARHDLSTLSGAEGTIYTGPVKTELPTAVNQPTTLARPLSPRQRRIQMFVRARKPGENVLTGISTRRLFSIPIAP